MESLIHRIMIPMAAGNKCSNIGAVNLSDLEHQEVITNMIMMMKLLSTAFISQGVLSMMQVSNRKISRS